MPIIITNSTDQTLTMRSFDGDSVTVPPKARNVRVFSKFNWEVPKGIVIVRDLGDDELPDQGPPSPVPTEPMPVAAPAGLISTKSGGKAAAASE